MKKIIILGSTGSIGQNTLDIVRKNPEMFEVLALCCKSNVIEFVRQILEFRPKFVVMEDEILLASVKTKTIHLGCKFIGGKGCFKDLAAQIDKFDCLVSAISGFAGMEPTFTLLPKAKTLAIANKESIICAGKFLKNEAQKHNVKIIPIDSEHNSLYRIKSGVLNNSDIEKYTITASGGMVLGKSLEEIKALKAKDIANPNWKMGQKITIDSNTMANKALELMEACVLFDINYKQVDAIIQRQSIIHAMLYLKDGSVTAFLSNPDMQIHIGHAISDGVLNIKNSAKKLDLIAIKNLDFAEISHEKYKMFYLGRFALKVGHEAQIIFNASNEVAVRKFIDDQIGFCDIEKIVSKCLEADFSVKISSIDDVKNLDEMARKYANSVAL
ncbi:1-deoxy-D-xylulose-5-phosphate reductoisomerase [Candidatus Deianiraea vastatrix]|nr:1-deoxy-D-xylulose-5-phosphate reductoisomerase [Candidatus Deianiraea vastatrix]